MLFEPISEPFIIEERRGVIAVFKPRGWHSVALPCGQSQTGKSMVDWIITRARELPSSELAQSIDTFKSMAMREKDQQASLPPRPARARDRFASELGMLYRLDFETSGIMLFALTRSGFERMKRAQERFELEKRYVVICSESTVGVPGSLPVSRASERAAFLEDIREGRGGRVESYFRGYGERGARVACIAPEFFQKMHKKTTKIIYTTRFPRGTHLSAAEAARLMPENVSASSPPGPIVLEAQLRKGFRHQIRAHCAWMGLPIAGDPLYGGATGERLLLEAYEVALMDEERIVDKWMLHAGIEALQGEESSLS